MPCRKVGIGSAVTLPAAMPAHLLAHRGNGALQALGNSPKLVAGRNAARDFFALDKTEHAGRSASSCRPYTACGLQDAMNRRRSLAQRTPNPKDCLAGLISTPEFFALRTCDCRGTSWSHAEHLLG